METSKEGKEPEPLAKQPGGHRILANIGSEAQFGAKHSLLDSRPKFRSLTGRREGVSVVRMAAQDFGAELLRRQLIGA
jgi:hypothetical protein